MQEKISTAEDLKNLKGCRVIGILEKISLENSTIYVNSTDGDN
jgi:hypothetical protein